MLSRVDNASAPADRREHQRILDTSSIEGDSGGKAGPAFQSCISVGSVLSMPPRRGELTNDTYGLQVDLFEDFR